MLKVKNLEIIPPQGEERFDSGQSSGRIVCELSRAKAAEVAAKNPDAIVIAADTLVECDGLILGKPKDEEQARQMLRMLSGNTHSVFTGVTVVTKDRMLSSCEETKVSFIELSEADISAYIATGEPMDKAGAYGAQGIASLFVSGIEGDFFNVMGLPLCKLGEMLKKLGVNIIEG